MILTILESSTTILRLSPQQRTLPNSDHFLSKAEARYWNAKLDSWLHARRQRKLTLREEIHADAQAALAAKQK